MKLLKKIIIFLLIFIVVIAAVGVLGFELYIKPKYGDKILSIANTFLADEDIQGIISQIDTDELSGVINNISDKIPNSTNAPIATKVPTPTKAPTTPSPNSLSLSLSQKNGDMLVSAPTKEPIIEATYAPTEEPTKSPSKSNSYSDKIEEAKNSVAPKDLADGMKIANKIDIGYLSGLTSGGLTTEEKVEISNYLHSRLSGSEITKLKSLIAKYSYLLN